MFVKSRGLMACFLVCASLQASALGIDKRRADLDVSKSFKSISTFIVFNEGNTEDVFATARGMKWDSTEDNPVVMTPTDELQIFPSVQRIPAGGSAQIKVRYAGPPVNGERTYRLMVTEMRIPKGMEDDGKKSFEEITAASASGTVQTAMTVPIYVSDRVEAKDLLTNLQYFFRKTETESLVVMKNPGSFHVEVTGLRINGVDKELALGPVLGGKTRFFPIKSEAAIDRVEVQIKSGRDSSWVVVPPEKK